MNRRDILTAAPAAGLAALVAATAPSGAAVSDQVAVLSAGRHVEPVNSAGQVEQDADDVERLPFVRAATRDELKSGLMPRIFWGVKPTGDYIGDCATGARYARLAISYMSNNNCGYVLGWIARDMHQLVEEFTGIEVGFWGEIGRNTGLLRNVMSSIRPPLADA